ncbi:MAG: hypothetical protein AUG50_04130 [Betaproteobacteria bacterium 13_1_20CM_3_63_8]|nr:MAG: hypothetical protein AUG50_04130 [Betaproteobacteria bacterium 13_1_20CM_3_63_8]
MDLGEHCAVSHRAFGRALEVAGIMQQRDDDAEHRAPRAQPVGRGAGALVPIDEPRHGERHVEGMAQVVVQGVAGEIARIASGEERAEIGERARERREIAGRVARCKQRKDRVADLIRVFDVHAIGDVVLVQTILHRARRQRRRSLP